MKKDFIFQCLCFLIYIIIDRCDGAGLLNELSGIACEVRKGIVKKLNQIERDYGVQLSSLEDETTYKGRRHSSYGSYERPRRISTFIRKRTITTGEKSKRPTTSYDHKTKRVTPRTKPRKIITVHIKTKRPSTSNNDNNEDIQQQKVWPDAHFYPTALDHITTRETSQDYNQETSKSCSSCTTEKKSETTTHLGLWSKIKKTIVSKFGLDKNSNPKNREIAKLKLNEASEIPMVYNGVSSEKETSYPKLKMKAKLAEVENGLEIKLPIKCTTKVPLPKLDSKYAPNENNSNMNSGNPNLCKGEVEEKNNDFVPPEPEKVPKHYIDDE